MGSKLSCNPEEQRLSSLPVSDDYSYNYAAIRTGTRRLPPPRYDLPRRLCSNLHTVPTQAAGDRAVHRESPPSINFTFKPPVCTFN